jgi:hypothetical protein
MEGKIQLPQEEVDAIIRNKRKKRDPKGESANTRMLRNCDLIVAQPAMLAINERQAI